MEAAEVQNIGQKALRALLYEVAASPKPGLVDRFNSGAHQDMDFYTFLDSSSVLGHYFTRCAAAGASCGETDPRELFRSLRTEGLVAEASMFAATGGVNTHKGLIFSLGVLCAAAACCLQESQEVSVGVYEICSKTRQMTQGLCVQELTELNKGPGLTSGERLFKLYGMQGIRGEVEGGFLTVRKWSLPLFQQLKAKGHHPNDVLVQTLLQLMAVNQDTNIVARHGLPMLTYVQKYAAEVLIQGGVFGQFGVQPVREMDEDFTSKNISPGGSADLLAVTVLLDLLVTEK
jgi:triphosphoribosyl-dephospho-CoA synthase